MSGGINNMLNQCRAGEEKVSLGLKFCEILVFFWGERHLLVRDKTTLVETEGAEDDFLGAGSNPDSIPK